MKKLIAVFCVCAALAATSFDAEAARRLGGGSSFGRTAPTFSQKAPATPAAAPRTDQAQQPGRTTQTQQTRPTPAPAQKPSMMRSVLTGLAAALGISALLSMLGINGAGMVSFVTGLLLMAVAFLAFRFFMSRRGRQTAQASGPAAPSPWQQTSEREASVSRMEEAREAEAAPQPSYGDVARAGSVMDQFMGGGKAADTSHGGVADITPADFDREGFLQSARTNYIKLQAAWDTGNVMTLSDFTTNDVFIAITHQLRERGNVPYKTEILSITNELLGIAREGDEYVASVRFIGKLRINGEEESVDETWVLVKPTQGDGGWLLAGIKQNDAPVADM